MVEVVKVMDVVGYGSLDTARYDRRPELLATCPQSGFQYGVLDTHRMYIHFVVDSQILSP